MSLRRFVSPYARLPVLALLVGVTVIGLATHPADAPAEAPARTPDPGHTSLPFAILLALAIPATVLLTIAAVRYRRRPAPRPPVQRRAGRQPPRRWLAALALLGLLTVTVAGSALAARLSRPDPPPAEPRPSPTPASSVTGAPEDLAWLLVAASTLLTLLIVAAIAHIRSTAEEPAPKPPPPPTLAEAVHRALAAVTQPADDPRTAIIRSYAAMENALTTVPAAAPHAADSPSEVLHRAAALGAVRSPGAWRLVELFDEARFSPHPMTEHDRLDAVAAIRLILVDIEGRS
ncbi:MAG TPA: DUF4129 domain-containing protein [Actinophytocola sp.]|jgi:hypothetical protein|uniref:DUF4129 domain-containing protein n=1 Tax=Actinophytocola sp. TaxID=1872138 RepID=UPI002E066AC3|nr:DUF4129 domain-containing protein [Actinophytocola sp.]